MSREPGRSRHPGTDQTPERARQRECARERLARLSAEQACLLVLGFTRTLTPAEEDGLARLRAQSEALLVDFRRLARAA